MSDYRKDLIARFWEYQREYFADWQKYLERPFEPDGRPPVFLKHTAHHNILMEPSLSPARQKQLLDEVPANSRHRWFRSMKSSQALTQSVFANLKILGCLHYLEELTDESGEPLFGDEQVTPANLALEHEVSFLGEPRPTNLDVFISGNYQVAIECKFTEADVGPCSRPRLTERNSKYEDDYCDGTYTQQRGRKARCSLTRAGVLYWKYVPGLFIWRDDIDHKPCPLAKNYQLVRNLLAACVRPGGSSSHKRGHVLMIYDERNPAFQYGGNGFSAFEETRAGLKTPSLLRKCSWQRITKHLRTKADLSWLTEQLAVKYRL
jgi:hypothetical protein